jgi:uridine phosphorylase
MGEEFIIRQSKESAMSKSEHKPSEAVKTSEGRQYHINLAPSELADYILLFVDPVRAKRLSSYFDQVTLTRSNREFTTYTGTYKGHPISVFGTGIGQDNNEIFFVEAIQLFPEKKPTMIQVGSCGGLQPDVAVGDLVITSGSVRLENTSTYFVDEGYPAVAHHEIVLALIAAADQLGATYHVGLTASTSGFFGAQGRAVGGLKPRDPNITERLADWNVLNMEMESSTLLTLGNLAGVRTGNVRAVYSNRVRGEWIDDQTRATADKAAEMVGLEAVRLLATMDAWKAKHQKANFVPQLPS